MAGPGDGKRVVITGAGRGLGRAFALALAREGASLVINDVDGEALGETATQIEDSGGTAVAVTGPVTEFEVCEEIVEQCVAKFEAIDCLVNNAAHARDRTLFHM